MKHKNLYYNLRNLHLDIEIQSFVIGVISFHGSGDPSGNHKSSRAIQRRLQYLQQARQLRWKSGNMVNVEIIA